MQIKKFNGGNRGVGGMNFVFFLARHADVITFPTPADPKNDATTLQQAGEASTGLSMVAGTFFHEIKCEIETPDYKTKLVNPKNGAYESTFEMMISSMDSETIGLVNMLSGEELVLVAPENCSNGSATKFMGSSCSPVKLEVSEGGSGAKRADDRGYKLTFRTPMHGFNYTGTIPLAP